MKSIHLYIVVLGLLLQSPAIGQIQSVTLQASGLTCSMCSRAIYKSLQKVPSVSKVQEDIEHSSYHIQFVDPGKVSLENLKKAVQDAGFSVAKMEVKANFNNAFVASDSSLKMSDFIFYFVDIPKQNLNGDKKLLILDKDFLLDKDRKKYGGDYSTMPSANGNDRIFHVTIEKS
ncbi:MAG TPA: cation transporter [Puia sp.]|jgi:copper chaperone CopZ|nr:cation transporter [Puia sp.]